MIELACKLANDRRKIIVSNFGINLIGLRRYAAIKKYGWIIYLIERGQIVIVDSSKSIAEILGYKNAVILVDEAQIWISATHYKEIPRSLLMDLQQSRKNNADVIWAAQVDAHVALQWRQQSHYFIHSDGIQKYSKQLKNQRLIWRSYFFFDADSYWSWVEDKKARRSYFRTRFNYAISADSGRIGKEQKLLFGCYDSFTRLELQKEFSKAADSVDFCVLPRDYYFDRCSALNIPYREFIIHDPAFTNNPWRRKMTWFEVFGIKGWQKPKKRVRSQPTKKTLAKTKRVKLNIGNWLLENWYLALGIYCLIGVFSLFML